MAIYTVSQVTTYLNEVLAYDEVVRDMWVEGEIANVARPASGHAYFTLRDGVSSLRCVMFRNSRGMEHLLDGAAIVAHGRLAVYEVRGDLQLVADIAQPEGAGELQLKLEQLKLKLEQEGLFEPSRKRPVPEFPHRVGVITSPSGAVWHDIQTVVARRYPLAELALAPTAVQGDTAAAWIVEAFQAMNAEDDIDVIIIARGGGSLEELWPFNEEVVARAIYACRTPVVCGVGHETDTTIADQVADVRAPTPSAAAELVVPHQDVLRRQLAELVEQSLRAMALAFGERRTAVAGLVRRLDGGLPNLETWRRRVDDLARGVDVTLVNRVSLTRSQVEGLGHRLRALDPAATLSRGFSVVQNASSGQVVSSTAQVATGDALTITVSDGQVPATAGPGARPKAARKARPAAKGHGMERLL